MVVLRAAHPGHSSPIVLTDCDYRLKLNGINTTHHFAVTEVYVERDGQWNLIQFSFTALSS